jgi:hypothetical protein
VGLNRLPIQGPFGGVVLSRDPVDLSPSEAQIAESVTVDEYGRLAKRRGTNRFNTGLPLGVRGARELFFWGERQVVMASYEGQIHKLPTTTGGSGTQLYTGTASKIWRFAAMRNSLNDERVWAVDGPADPPKKWDGAAGTVSDWLGSPPRGIVLAVWQNRMIIANDETYVDRLWFSPVGDPEGAYGFIDLRSRGAAAESDAIFGLVPLGENLIVLKQDSIWQVYDPVSFANRRLGEPGMTFVDAFDLFDNRVYYFSRGGVWSTDGAVAPRLESDNISPYLDDRVGSVDYTTQIPARIHGSPRDGRLYLIVPTSSTASMLWEARPRESYQRPDGETVIPWWKHPGLNPVAMCEIVENVTGNPQSVTLLSTDDDSEVLRLFPPGVYDDRGVPISSRWVTGWRGIQTEEPRERLRRVNFVHEGPVTVKVYKDLDLSVAKFQRSYPSAGKSFNRARPETRGHYHAVELADASFGPGWTIEALEVVYRGGKEH